METSVSFTKSVVSGQLTPGFPLSYKQSSLRDSREHTISTRDQWTGSLLLSLLST